MLFLSILLFFLIPHILAMLGILRLGRRVEAGPPPLFPTSLGAPAWMRSAPATLSSDRRPRQLQQPLLCSSDSSIVGDNRLLLHPREQSGPLRHCPSRCPTTSSTPANAHKRHLQYFHLLSSLSPAVLSYFLLSLLVRLLSSSLQFHCSHQKLVS